MPFVVVKPDFLNVELSELNQDPALLEDDADGIATAHMLNQVMVLPICRHNSSQHLSRIILGWAISESLREP